MATHFHLQQNQEELSEYVLQEAWIWLDDKCSTSASQIIKVYTQSIQLAKSEVSKALLLSLTVSWKGYVQLFFPTNSGMH